MKHLFILLLTMISLVSTIKAAGPPCPPFSECWCAQNPEHPRCSSAPCFPPQACVPINEGILFLVLAGIGLIIYFSYKIPICPPHELIYEKCEHKTIYGVKKYWRWKCKHCHYIQEKNY